MQRRMLSIAAATGLGLALAVLTTSPSHATPGATTLGTAAPEPARCGVIDFDSASVTPVASTGSVPPSIRYRLTVTGTKSASNVSVKLSPLVYVRQPEFWGIEVVGCSSGIGLPVLTPFTATYEFSGAMGTCGVEVVGTSTRQQFDLAGCVPVSLSGTRWVLDPASLGVPVPSGTSVTANFSATTVSGYASCNSYTAQYTTDKDGAFKVGMIAMTARLCDPVSNQAESTFMKQLTAARQVRVTATELRLLADGKMLLRFVPATSAA